MSNLLAISVIQPWAWLILRPDIVGAEARAEARERGLIKDIENRVWRSSTRGWVLLHASATKLAKWDWQAAGLFAAKRGVFDLPLQGNCPLGAYVGAIRIDDCVTWSRSRWFAGDGLGFVIGDAVPFAAPVVGPGSLNFFPVPFPGCGAGGEQLRAEVCAAIRAVRLEAAFNLSPS